MVLTIKHSPSINKAVRFAPDESLCEYCRSSYKLSKPTVHRLWYQSADYEIFQMESAESVTRALKMGLMVYIKQTYGYTDAKTQANLNIWAKCQDSRRGLERFVNEEYGSQRLLHRRKAIQAVLHSQEKLRKDNQAYSTACSVIKTISTTLSSNAVQFARMLAIADREAVLSLQDENIKPSVRRLLSLPGPSRRSSKELEEETRSFCETHTCRPPRHPGRPQIEFMIVSTTA
jgi:hypothetical protein